MTEAAGAGAGADVGVGAGAFASLRAAVGSGGVGVRGARASWALGGAKSPLSCTLTHPENPSRQM